MRNQDKTTRQSLGCAYEAPIENARPWQPPSLGKVGFRYNAKAPLDQACPGYSTSLPQVAEVARAYTHWDKGQLETFCGGQPNDSMLFGVEVLNSEVQQQQAWEMTPANEGGGRK